MSLESESGAESASVHGASAPNRDRLWCVECEAWVPEYTWDYHAPHGTGDPDNAE